MELKHFSAPNRPAWGLVHGDTNVHWARATVDPENLNVFAFEPMILPGD